MWPSARVQGTKVRFAVVDGGREWTEPSRLVPQAVPSVATVEDVEAEARRRLRAIKLQEWRAREFITGQQVPADVRHYALQVEFASQAISCLSPIPGDFDSDVYWPRLFER